VRAKLYSHELNQAVHKRIPGDIVTMMALNGWNAFGIYEVVSEEMKMERERKKALPKAERKGQKP
jgi:hypothetical protein